MKKLLFMSGAFVALVMGACSGNAKSDTADSAPVQEIVQVTDTGEDYRIADEGLVSGNGLPILADFSATWCPPCQKLKPIFHALKEEYAGKVNFVTIDTDSMPGLAQKYGIESIPALFYISPDGKVLDSSVGFVDAAQIKAAIEKNFGK